MCICNEQHRFETFLTRLIPLKLLLMLPRSHRWDRALLTVTSLEKSTSGSWLGRGKGDKGLCIWVSLFVQPSPFPIKALQPQSPGSQTCTMWPCFGIHALLVVAVTLSPVTAVARSGNDASGENVYPPFWDLAPENVLDFPVKDNKIVIRAWNFQDRLGVYKSLLNASAKYFAAFGPQNSGNILWGLPLQHGWQFRTGMNYVIKMLD